MKCAEGTHQVRPADVIGQWAFLTHPEPSDAGTEVRVESIKAMLASAEFVRRRWLLALRRRYDAEARKNLPDGGGGGAMERPPRRRAGLTGAATAVKDAAAGAAATATAAVEDRASRTAAEAAARAGGDGEAGEKGGGASGGGWRAGGSDVGQVADHGAAVTENGDFFRAGVWLGRVASPEIFRNVFGYL